MREFYLPKFRRAEKYPSLAAAESMLLMENVGYLRALFREKKLPRRDWLYEHFTERGVQERDAVLSMYSEKVRRMFAPSNLGMPVQRITLHLYESASSALSELQFAYSAPFSFLYTLTITHAFLQLPNTLPKDREELYRIKELLESRVEQVATWVSRVDSLVGMPDYLRVANFLERDQMYTVQSLSVIAMSVAVIHAGMPASQRMRKIAHIIDRLVDEGYLKDVPNRSGVYLCVKEFADEYGGAE